MTGESKPSFVLPSPILAPAEFQKGAQQLFKLEHPNFQELQERASDRMNMIYASLVLGLRDRLRDDEKGLVNKVVGRVLAGQLLFDERQYNAHRDRFVDHDESYDTFLKHIRFLASLAERSPLAFPVMSSTHNVIISVEKTGEDRFELSLYNAGFETALADGTIYTHEAKPKRQRAVYGYEKYETCYAGLDLALQRFLTYSLWTLDRDGFVELYRLARSDLGAPKERGLTHAQVTPNCSTRTFREYLRFNLPDECYQKIYTAISGADRSVDRAELIKTSQDIYLKTYLSLQFAKAFPELRNSNELHVFAIVPLKEGYFIGVSDRTLRAAGELFSSCSDPKNSRVIFMPTHELQELYTEVANGLDAHSALTNLAAKLSPGEGREVHVDRGTEQRPRSDRDQPRV